MRHGQPTGANVGINLRRTFLFFAGERLIQKGREEDHFSVPTVEQRGMFNSGATGLFLNGVPAFPTTVAGNAVFSLCPFPNDPSGLTGAIPTRPGCQPKGMGSGLHSRLTISSNILQSGLAFEETTRGKRAFARRLAVRSMPKFGPTSRITALE